MRRRKMISFLCFFFAKKREESTFKGSGEQKKLKIHGYSNVPNNHICTIAFFSKKSQLKNFVFFSCGVKLFLLILFKHVSLYEVKAKNKTINGNNFYGLEKKREILSVIFWKKMRTVHVRLFVALKYKDIAHSCGDQRIFESWNSGTNKARTTFHVKSQVSKINARTLKKTGQ